MCARCGSMVSQVAADLEAGNGTVSGHCPHPHGLTNALEGLLARSSNETPDDVRASERTVSETSTSGGADSPLMRAAMLTAPP